MGGCASAPTTAHPAIRTDGRTEVVTQRPAVVIPAPAPSQKPSISTPTRPVSQAPDIQVAPSSPAGTFARTSSPISTISLSPGVSVGGSGAASAGIRTAFQQAATEVAAPARLSSGMRPGSQGMSGSAAFSGPPQYGATRGAGSVSRTLPKPSAAPHTGRDAIDVQKFRAVNTGARVADGYAGVGPSRPGASFGVPAPVVNSCVISIVVCLFVSVLT
jgi:hypothetical protein